MLITSDQIRAARALISWSQADLAEYSGLARPTIVNIETGVQIPELKTIEKIVAAFDNANVEFGVNESVRRKNEDIKTYRGKEEFVGFFIELYENARDSGGEIFISNADERQWVEMWDNFLDSSYALNMKQIRNKVDFRILIKENDDFMPAAPYAKYKWLTESDFATVPFHVHADKMSIFLFLDEPIIISICNKKAADTYKEKFIEQWKNALPVKKKVKK